MEMPDRLPSSTVRADGGISISTAPIAMIGPVASTGLYPRDSMTGSINDPSMAVVAMVDTFALWALAAATTVVLNLDTTIVLLTPLYVRIARRADEDPLALALVLMDLLCPTRPAMAGDDEIVSPLKPLGAGDEVRDKNGNLVKRQGTFDSYADWMTGRLVYPDVWWRHDSAGLRDPDLARLEDLFARELSSA